MTKITPIFILYMHIMFIYKNMFIKNIIKDNNYVISAYSICDEVENDIHWALSSILENHECSALLAPVYVSVKELLINAIKANYKNIYFEGYAPKSNLSRQLDYETALRLFQLEISRENSFYFEQMARKNEMKAEIELWTQNNMLHVSVINPVKMTEMEINNIRKKMNDAENCSDIAEYFMKNMNDPHREGAGIGLVLIIMMLKSLKAPNDSLSICTDDDRTTAYLKIPMINDVQNCA